MELIQLLTGRPKSTRWPALLLRSACKICCSRSIADKDVLSQVRMSYISESNKVIGTSSKCTTLAVQFQFSCKKGPPTGFHSDEKCGSNQLIAKPHLPHPQRVAPGDRVILNYSCLAIQESCIIWRKSKQREKNWEENISQCSKAALTLDSTEGNENKATV